MSSPNTKTILIVEDESDMAEMYTQMLQRNGYGVERASGGVAAMKHLLHIKPDLILLDLMMPDVSGLEVLRFLRREPQYMDLPVVIVSAKSLPEDIEKGMLAGASVYLTKPIAYRELIQTIGALLANRA